MKTLSFIILLVVTNIVAYSQPFNDTLSVNKLRQIDFMLGKWEGDGWIMMGPNNKKYFHQNETVSLKAGGITMTIDGQGVSTDSTSGQKQIVHDAFSIIDYNKETETFELTSFSAKHGKNVSEFKLLDNNIAEWSFKEPRGGTIRFTEDFSKDNTWNVIGTYSFDGQKWFTFFEMNLKKLKG